MYGIILDFHAKKTYASYQCIFEESENLIDNIDKETRRFPLLITDVPLFTPIYIYMYVICRTLVPKCNTFVLKWRSPDAFPPVVCQDLDYTHNFRPR